jgi:hypothetical protein
VGKVALESLRILSRALEVFANKRNGCEPYRTLTETEL